MTVQISLSLSLFLLSPSPRRFVFSLSLRRSSGNVCHEVIGPSAVFHFRGRSFPSSERPRPTGCCSSSSRPSLKVYQNSGHPFEDFSLNPQFEIKSCQPFPWYTPIGNNYSIFFEGRNEIWSIYFQIGLTKILIKPNKIFGIIQKINNSVPIKIHFYKWRSAERNVWLFIWKKRTNFMLFSRSLEDPLSRSH